MPGKKRPSHAGIQNIKKNKAAKSGRNQQSASWLSSVQHLIDQFQQGVEDDNAPSFGELFEAGREGLSNLGTGASDFVHGLGDILAPQFGSNSNSSVQSLNDILSQPGSSFNHRSAADQLSAGKRPRSDSPPRSPPRSPSPPPDNPEEENKDDIESESESDSDEELLDADNSNPTPSHSRRRVKPPPPSVVHCEMSDIDSHHLSYNVTSIAEVWNDPTVASGSGPIDSTDIPLDTKFGYAEIDAYKFQPLALWTDPSVSSDVRQRLQALFNLYQEFRLVKITASYYPNNNNTVTSPALTNVATAPNDQFSGYPSAEGIVYQPYNCCIRFDRNDAVSFTEPSNSATTIEILNRIFAMESMNGTKCFRSDQPCTFSFEPTTLAGVINATQSGAPNQPPLSSTTVATRPIDAPWQPTKVATSNQSSTVFNLNTVFYSLKFGMYNMQFMNNLKKFGQMGAINGAYAFKRWHYAVQLGNIKFSWRFEFRIREERPIISSFQSLDGQSLEQVVLFERLRQNFPTTLGEEKVDDTEKTSPLKRSAAIAGLETLL